MLPYKAAEVIGGVSADNLGGFVGKSMRDRAIRFTTRGEESDTNRTNIHE
jgi:hypothetical protein